MLAVSPPRTSLSRWSLVFSAYLQAQCLSSQLLWWLPLSHVKVFVYFSILGLTCIYRKLSFSFSAIALKIRVFIFTGYFALPEALVALNCCCAGVCSAGQQDAPSTPAAALHSRLLQPRGSLVCARGVRGSIERPRISGREGTVSRLSTFWTVFCVVQELMMLFVFLRFL